MAKMDLCVGAVSPRVVEVAAQVGVHQIVASRGQVDIGGGYTGLDQFGLVELVRRWSPDVQIIRDHGGPGRGRAPTGDDAVADDGTRSFDADVAAGFTGLHIDVCEVPYDDQPRRLRELLEVYGQSPITIEVGGERDVWAWNRYLLDTALQAGCTPSYVVADTGAYVWADRQIGTPSVDRLHQQAEYAHNLGVKLKAHNMDWVNDWHGEFAEYIDAYNVAPALGVLETQAVLSVLPWTAVSELLEIGYDSHLWERWFTDGQGTADEQARCAIRYMQTDPRVVELTTLNAERESYVRRVLRDAILAV